jgi:hypothetical protein
MSVTETPSDSIDILRAVAIEFPCPSCGGKYALTLDQVLLSQQVIHESCPPGSDRECPPMSMAFAPVLDHATITALRFDWSRLNEQAAANGGQLALSLKE